MQQRRRWWYCWSISGASWHSFAHLDDKWISTAVIYQKGVEIRSTEASKLKIWVMPTGKPSTQQRQWLRTRQSRMGSMWWIWVVVPSAWAPTAYSQGYNLSLTVCLFPLGKEIQWNLGRTLFRIYMKWIWVVQMVSHSERSDLPLCPLKTEVHSSSYWWHHWLTVIRNYHKLESSALHKFPCFFPQGSSNLITDQCIV